MWGRQVSLLARCRALPTRFEFAEGPGNNMPFQTKNKVRLFIVLMGGASFGFSLPFIATYYQLKKKQTS